MKELHFESFKDNMMTVLKNFWKMTSSIVSKHDKDIGVAI
jgi:hypothetical protein